jgi:cyclophilin family peptidyl-prolyl cis-trans isomerase/HEAT repeat protein
MLKAYTYRVLKCVYPDFCSRAGRFALCLLVFTAPAVFSQRRSQVLQNPTSFTSVPQNLLIQIIRAEDERRWDNDVRSLFSARSAVVRKRAALAAGRIGSEDSVADLTKLLQHDDDMDVRVMAAFALGEAESASAAVALLEVLKSTQEPPIRARTIEALGKIAAALPKEQEARARQLGDGILEALKFESERRPARDRLTVLLGLTAALRARTSNGGQTIAGFLSDPDPRIRADAANTLARLRLKEGNDQLRRLLKSDPDPVVRANAARVMGATTDKAAFDALVELATKDEDSRVRVSAVRVLAALKDQEPRVANVLASMWCERKLLMDKKRLYHERDAECLELVTALGKVFQGTGDQSVRYRLDQHWRWDFRDDPPELEVALVRISPKAYLESFGDDTASRLKVQRTFLSDWREASSLAHGLGEFAALPESTKDKKELVTKAETLLRAMLDYRNYPGSQLSKKDILLAQYAIPDVLRAFAAFKTKDLGHELRKQLNDSDIIVRGTAAELLGELPPDDVNTRALIEALPLALQDKELNDAALAIIDSLGKQKNTQANEAIKTALGSPDHLIRRKAVGILKTNGAGDFSSRIGTVQTRNTIADYQRALGRVAKNLSATVTTTKGVFTLQLFPDEAPLTVDNFVQLAKQKYFNGVTVHRVVPNFVIQDGDPRGDGNGGPGYSIRCEINDEPFERGALGMALSGKDTGGSQWFVTHSPQPHLDGGYTVFGRVIQGMEIVDNIVRGDVIRSIQIKESSRRASTGRDK